MPRVLVGDDDPDVRSVLDRYLTAAGYEVVEAVNGRDCLELLRTSAVDLAVLDIYMPELDGIAVIARARQDFPQLPILAMSGGGTVPRERTLEIARRLGATRTLTKPFEREDFIAVVRELLGEP